MLKVATKFTPEIQAFENANAAGFGYAEFWLDARWLDQWETIAERASSHPFEYALHFPNRGDLPESTLRQSIQLYRALQCEAMVIHAPMLRRYGEWLVRQDAKLKLGVENHRLSPTEFERWAVDNTWLTLDVEHLWKFTLEDAELDVLIREISGFLARFRDKLIHVHLPGYVPGFAEHRPMYCSRDMVLAVFSLLADHQFDGLIVSEIEVPFQNVAELQMDVLLYERWRQLRQSSASVDRASGADTHVA